MTDTRSRGRHLSSTMVAAVALLASGLFAVVPPAGVAAVAAAPRAVIIVGPTEGSTNGYVNDAQEIAAEAADDGLAVVKLYSAASDNTVARPGTGGVLAATWQNVVTYVNGTDSGGRPATIIVYLGHGNGYPNPYTPGHLYPDRVDGFVLDATSGTPCAVNGAKGYCGEGPIAADLHPATNAIVLLEHLCYASGDSEWDTGKPTQAVAEQRVDNYAAGFLAAGAAAVFAYGTQDVGDVIHAIFTTNQSLDDVFMSTGYHGGSDIRFDSTRSPGYAVHMDPFDGHAPDGDPYYRSVVGNLGLTTDQVGTPDPDRWAGTDRYATAAVIAGKSFTRTPAPVVFIASGANFPDALAGAAAAASKDAPLLITAPASLSAATAAQLTRLKPGKIVILGSASAVSDHVKAQLGAYVTDPAHGITRVAGSDRYATAAAISTTYFASAAPVPVLYVATGANFPDALAGAAAAGHLGAPVLLVDATSIPSATAAAIKTLKPKAIRVLGSATVIGAGVLSALQKDTSGAVTRLSGTDRYATAVDISTSTYPGSPHVPVLYVATGANFPDALVGAALGAPLILVPGTSVPSDVLAEIKRLDPQRVIFLGGPGAVSYGAELMIQEAVPSAS